MFRHFTLFSLLLILISCGQTSPKAPIEPVSIEENYTQFVNPFIGTGGHGHTFPGSTLPFGMVQLSPDTRLDGWDGCGGYHYSDSVIYGFSHTHLSGTGVSDYGDILLMPTNAVVFNNGADGEVGYSSSFSHENEEAKAGYYKVNLDDTDIEVELTTTLRAGIHRYHFPTSENQVIILDLEHRDKLLDHKIEKTSPTALSGYRHSQAWANDQRLFFYIEFSHPIESEVFNADQKPTKGAFVLDNPENEPVIVKVGISAVDEEGAKQNMLEEIGGLSFDEVRKNAQDAWNTQLSKIAIEESDLDRKTTFYTSLYHTMIAPNLYQDIDGRYRGMDLEIHETKDFDYYTVFSLWDTYRAAHPLFTIIEQERTNDFINTMLAKYEEGGIIPIWDLSAGYTGCMIGYHGIPVIADAYLKGINGYDEELAFEAMMHSATRDHLGLEGYKKNGFVAVESESESVSKTLEYAYDDWTIAQVAKAMGKTADYETYLERAQSYKNHFDPSTGFMRARFRNTWFSPFDPYEVNFNYTEANAWQYSLYVPQDISGHFGLMGGKKKYEGHLDQLFSAKNETAGRHQADITGLIGQYAHGNEPSHHMAYLYNFVNKPSKSQEIVNEILTTLYSNSPDGISGNEDCGQMSAWYVFSALGFYPVTPGSNHYIIGSPLVEKATINLENGNQFTIVANGVEEGYKYIKSASLNGESLERSYLEHNEIVAGGTLVFELSPNPTDWASTDADIPQTEIKEHLILTPPFIANGESAFKNTTLVELGHIDPTVEIYYQWNEAEFLLYKEPFELSEKGKLSVYAKKDEQESVRLETEFFKIDPNVTIELDSEFANEYSAGGNDALIDGIRGTSDFRTGSWQGYQNQDVVATINLGDMKTVSHIETAFLQDQKSWIFYPTLVTLEVSADGKTWESVKTVEIQSTAQSDEIAVKEIQVDFSERKIKRVRLTAKTVGPLPEWHIGYEYEGTAWVFIDEISVE
ncbi:GH92 family glycosyl hydrolase [Cryomorphaceae bacterium 1068]|nr:GH92 family glycosyl hydrolase [Cryomorphaceae bacterium 1068]